MTNTNDARQRSRLDVHQLMARAAAENAADLAEHGSYQRTAVDEADTAHTAFKIGMWELSHDNPADAKRWLTTAVDGGIDEARPLLQICTDALDPAPDDLDAVADEHDELLAEVHLAHAEGDEGSESEVDLPAAAGTPIYDRVVARDPDLPAVENLLRTPVTIMELATYRRVLRQTCQLIVPPIPPVTWLASGRDLSDRLFPVVGAAVVALALDIGLDAQIPALRPFVEGMQPSGMIFADVLRQTSYRRRGLHDLPAGARTPARTRDRDVEPLTPIWFPSCAEQACLPLDVGNETLVTWYATGNPEDDEELAARLLRRLQGSSDGQHVRLPGSDLIVPASQSDQGRHVADPEDQPAGHHVRSSLV